MSEGLKDRRRRALEQQYLLKKNQEALKRLREKMRVAQEAKEAGQSSMRCPRCTGRLIEIKVEDVLIDQCNNCSCLWFDPGEFGELVQKDVTDWFTRWWGRD